MIDTRNLNTGFRFRAVVYWGRLHKGTKLRSTMLRQIAKGLPVTVGEGDEQYKLREPIYSFANADTGTQRRVRTNVPGLASRISGEE